MIWGPPIVGNTHIISIYFQRDVDIIWCWILSTPSFSFNFLAPGNETHHFESQRTESEEQTPKVAEAFMASSVMGSSAPFRSRDSQVWYRFWPKHFSWRNLYQTSPAPCLQLGIRLEAPAVVARFRKLEKTEGFFFAKSRKNPRLPTRRRWSCPVYRKWRKTWSAPIPQAKCALVVRWFRLVPTRNVRSGFWKERQPGLWKPGIWRQEIQSSALVDHQLQLVKFIQNEVSGPCSFMASEIWCPIFRQNWLLDTADSSFRLVPGQHDVFFSPRPVYPSQQSELSDKVRITTVWGVEHQKK